MTEYYQWCNQNEFRKYPFQEEASMRSALGVELPARLVSDLQCYTQYSASQLYVCRAVKTSTIVSAVLNVNQCPVLAITLGIANMVPWKLYPLVPLDGVSSGYIAFGDLSNVDSFAGIFSGPSETGIEPKCVHSWHEPVLSIGKRGRNGKFTGIISFSAEANVSLNIVTEGCYSVVASGPYAGLTGVYVPTGEAYGRPIYSNIDDDTMKLFKGEDGLVWFIGAQSDPSFKSEANFPDRPMWVETSPIGPDSFTIEVLRCNLVDAGLSKSTMASFLGPCDNNAGACDGNVLRTIGGAKADSSGKLRIVSLPPEEA